MSCSMPSGRTVFRIILTALKTLVFRVRKMLEAAGFPSQDLILSQKGAYMWNPAWETEVDTDRFESLCGESGPGIGWEEYVGGLSGGI